MQWEQKLLQPYMMMTNAEKALARCCGRPSAIAPSLRRISTTGFLSSGTRQRYSGSRCRLCVPNTRPINGYYLLRRSAMPSSCAMQPPTQIRISGRSRFNSLSQMTLSKRGFLHFKRLVPAAPVRKWFALRESLQAEAGSRLTRRASPMGEFPLKRFA